MLFSWVSKWWNYVLNLSSFATILWFYPIFTCVDPDPYSQQAHKAPEYGSNTDPDPQHWLKPNDNHGPRNEQVYSVGSDGSEYLQPAAGSHRGALQAGQSSSGRDTKTGI